MKALRVVLICLVIFAVFNYTATALRPLIQQNDNPILKEKTGLYSFPKTRGQKEKPGPPGVVPLGDPIEDPLPHNH